MITRDIHKRIIALTTLCLFLLSTSGMVLFYHHCNYSDGVVYSMYIDSTNQLCQENADAEYHIQHPGMDCCNKNITGKNCCKNHKTYIKTAKLNNAYMFSDRQPAPKPIELALLIAEIPQFIELIQITSIKRGLWGELPPEEPLYKPFGKQLVTLHHALKIAC